MKKLAALFVLALVSAALIACGDDDGTTTTETATEETSGGAAAGGGEKAGGGEAGGSTIEFEADPAGGLAYTTDKVSAKAGQTTIAFNNPQPLAHDVAIEDANAEQIAKTDVITEGEDSTEVRLKPGEYTFYCTVPGHREGGMEGFMTVE